ncbi:MAG: Rrf2 family transcriptional regulator [Acidobacteriota bacterium]|nr:Rrf2 family transcriptional regulator [Acidobacteriota bacterium]
MLRLSKRSDYALIAMRHLAVLGDRSHPSPSSSARELAERFDIPVELLAKVLQKLVRAGLLVSHQGIRGGYVLARPAAAISVADVIVAIDGPLTVTACSDADQTCGQYSKCNVRDPLGRIKDRIVSALESCTVAELASDPPAAGAMHVHFGKPFEGRP